MWENAEVNIKGPPAFFFATNKLSEKNARPPTGSVCKACFACAITALHKTDRSCVYVCVMFSIYDTNPDATTTGMSHKSPSRQSAKVCTIHLTVAIYLRLTDNLYIERSSYLPNHSIVVVIHSIRIAKDLTAVIITRRTTEKLFTLSRCVP